MPRHLPHPPHPRADAGAAAPAAVPQATLPPPPPRASADFARALELVRAGKDEEAELEFQQVATGYPQYAGALVNLGLLYRKHGDLAKSEEALHSAVQRAPGDAEALNELGVTLRLAGKFHEAADAYNQAIAAKPDFAPAYRNLAIVLDLYLGDTAAALTAMEDYRSWPPMTRPSPAGSPISNNASARAPRRPRLTRLEAEHESPECDRHFAGLRRTGFRPGTESG